MIRQNFVDKQFLLSDRWILESGREKSDYFLYIARPFQVGSGSLCVELENIVVDKSKTYDARIFFFGQDF